MNKLYKIVFLVTAFLLQACAGGPQTPPDNLLSLTDAQLKIRSYQTKVFEVKDQIKVIRGVVQALQDLGFIVERVNAPMGMITAGKFAGDGHTGFVELTVIARPSDATHTEIRVNALYNTTPIEDPKIYQNFFNVVQRSLFVTG